MAERHPRYRGAFAPLGQYTVKGKIRGVRKNIQTYLGRKFMIYMYEKLGDNAKANFRETTCVPHIGVATGLLGVASNPNGNPSQYYTGVASNPNIWMLATPLAVPASPWQPQRENASYASGATMCHIKNRIPKCTSITTFKVIPKVSALNLQ